MSAQTAAPEVSSLRLTLLRAAYLVLVVGLGIFIWPSILIPSTPLAGMQAVVVSMLGAMSALAVAGLRHPLAMLPVLLFEIGWKALWMIRVALPLWLTGTLDASTTERFFECMPAVLIAAIVPWRYVWRTYGPAKA